MRESARRLVLALASAAPEVVVVQRARPAVVLMSEQLDPDVWAAAPLVDAGEVVVVGKLEMLDLASHRFRVRDAVGHDIRLTDVREGDVAGRLAGAEVRAVGTAWKRSDGTLAEVRDVTITAAAPLPETWTAARPVLLEDLLAEAPETPSGLELQLTDEEFDEFLRAVGA